MSHVFAHLSMLAIAVVSLPVFVLAAAGDMRDPTAAEKQELQLLGLKGEKTTDKELSQLRGGCGESPYAFLLTKYKPGAQSSKEGQAGITKLNSDFACRLSKFIKKYPSVCIISAYRSVATQTVLWNQALQKYGSASAARKWVAPPGSSMHNKGLAADLCNVPGGARGDAASFGLTFRMGHEPWHIEPNGSVSGTQPDGGAPANTSPTSGLGDSLRQAMGLDQPQPQAQPAIPPQPAQAVQQPTQYFQPQQAAPQQAGQPGLTGTPTSGSPGNTVTPIGSSVPISSSPLSTDEGVQFEDTKPSIGDQLMALAYGTSSLMSSTEIATSVPIFVSEKDSAGLKSSGKSGTTTSSTSSSLGEKDTLHPTQTFVSGDLSYRGGNGVAQNDILVFLRDMRARLLAALEILRPFSLRTISVEPDEFSE